MIEVRKLDGREMSRFYGRPMFDPICGYAARRGSRTIAVGGLVTGSDGKVWGFMDFKPGHQMKALYRYTLRLLSWAEREGIPEIWVSRDTGFKTSVRMLRRAGFEDDGNIDDHEIWVWRNKKVKNDVRY